MRYVAWTDTSHILKVRTTTTTTTTTTVAILAQGSKLEAGYEMHYAPRGPKTLPPGMRPEQLSEHLGLPRCDRTVRGTSQGAPLLAVQSLRGADGIDDIAVKLLIQLALKKKKERGGRGEEG